MQQMWVFFLLPDVVESVPPPVASRQPFPAHGPSPPPHAHVEVLTSRPCELGV